MGWSNSKLHKEEPVNSHVASEPAEVIVGVLTLDTAVEALRSELLTLLENTHNKCYQTWK